MSNSKRLRYELPDLEDKTRKLKRNLDMLTLNGGFFALSEGCEIKYDLFRPDEHHVIFSHPKNDFGFILHDLQLGADAPY